MIRYIRYGLWGICALALLCLALANRQIVTVRPLPDDLAAFFGVTWQADVPLFIVLFVGVGGGLLVGFLWEWARSYKVRSHAVRQVTQMQRLERELALLKDTKTQADPVLTLIDQK